MKLENAGNDFVVSTLGYLDYKELDLLWTQMYVDIKAQKINTDQVMHEAVSLEANAIARYKRSINSDNFIKEITSLTLHDIAPSKWLNFIHFKYLSNI